MFKSGFDLFLFPIHSKISDKKLTCCLKANTSLIMVVKVLIYKDCTDAGVGWSFVTVCVC